MRFLSPYRELSVLPGFGSALLVSIASKLRPGIASLALLLEVAHYRGLSEAALVVSVSGVAEATLPLRGKIMDRYGYGPLLGPGFLLSLAAMTVLVLNDRAGGPLAVTVAASLGASVTAPPIQLLTRLMWREMTAGSLRTTALSLDTALTDAGYVAGPTIAAFVVTAVTPWAGLAISASLSVLATVLLLRRGLPPRPEQPEKAQRHWLGPLADTRLRRIMAAAAAFFLAVRLIELAFPVWAQRYSAPLMSGVFLSCMSVGSLTGGLVMGGASSTRWAAGLVLRGPLIALGLGTLLVLAASFTSTAAMVAAAAVMGVALGPSFVAVWGTSGDLTPAHLAAETQAWISACMALGGSAAAALVSAVAPALGPQGVLLLAAVFLAVAAGFAPVVRTEPVMPVRVGRHRVRVAGRHRRPLIFEGVGGR